MTKPQRLWLARALILSGLMLGASVWFVGGSVRHRPNVAIGVGPNRRLGNMIHA